MFCSRCGQPLEESDRFCPKCGQKIEESTRERGQSQSGHEPENPLCEGMEEARGEVVSDNMPNTSAANGSVPPAYPYYHPVDPVPAPPKKKNRWVIPVVIVVAVLVLAIFIVGGILVYTVITTMEKEPTGISTTSQGSIVAADGKELSAYLGLTVEDLKNGSGVLLTEYSGTYTNLDGSIMVTLNESTGLIDMLVASDRDVGFTVCGVSIGMNREEAMNAARAYVSELEDYGDMIVGQNDEEYFAAYYEEDGIIHYAMYFTYEEDDSSGTNASRGTGIWYIGEPLQEVWDFFGTEYDIRSQQQQTIFSYPAEGLSFAVDGVEYTAQSLVSYVEMTDGAWFSDEIYIGMSYEEIGLFVDLSEIYQDETAGEYLADYSMILDGQECYGSFRFDSADPSASSIGAYMVLES